MITWGDPESSSPPLPHKFSTPKISPLRASTFGLRASESTLCQAIGPRLSVSPRRYAPRRNGKARTQPISQRILDTEIRASPLKSLSRLHRYDHIIAKHNISAGEGASAVYAPLKYTVFSVAVTALGAHTGYTFAWTGKLTFVTSGFRERVHCLCLYIYYERYRDMTWW